MTRARRERETPEFAAFARRAIRALGKRCGQSDPVDLRELLAMRDEVDAAILVAIRDLRDLDFSWGEIAAGLGTSKQAVQQRYARGGGVGVHRQGRERDHDRTPCPGGVTTVTLAG